MTTNDERRLLEQSDAVVDLYDLDYSNLLLDEGNPVYVVHFTPTTTPSPVELGGITYTKLPVEMRGLSVTSKGAPPRPTMVVSNGDGQLSALIDTIGGSIIGARLTRRRIYSRFLDGGATPDATQEWEPQKWIVERKKAHNRFTMQFELSAKHDIQGSQIPGRIVEASLCPWRYARGGSGGTGSECTWDPGGGPYYDENGDATTVENDMCGLRYSDCVLRFGANDQPLRYGGFVAVGRAFK